MWALLAPELILFWAIQQWLVAGDIADVNERARKERIAIEAQRMVEENARIAKNTRAAEDDVINLWEGEGLLTKAGEGIVERAAMEGEGLVNDDESVAVLSEV